MTATSKINWNPGAYNKFRDLRLQAAIDLAQAVPELPNAPVLDLGCGNGNAGQLLKGFNQPIWGVDSSVNMLRDAQETENYDQLIQADLTTWEPTQKFGLIFSNAVLHWIDDHQTLLPKIATWLAPDGVLAMQVPNQNNAPSHMAWRDVYAAHVQDTTLPEAAPSILSAGEYADIFGALGEFRIWETEYFQTLPPSGENHPVTEFTKTTYGRAFLEAVPEVERASLMAAYNERMETAYPLNTNGIIHFPFKRLFMVAIPNSRL